MKSNMSSESDKYSKLLKIHENAKSTLKECSFDNDKNQYLTLLELECINFDKVKSNYAEKVNISEMCSVDAALYKDNKLYFIEFKNQTSVKWKEVRLKVHESILILKEELKLEDSELNDIEVITVTKNNTKQQSIIDQIRGNMKSKAKNPDRIENFGIFEHKYGIKSIKLTELDFRTIVS